MKKRFTDEQIIRILKEAEAVGNIRDVCRQHNITEQTFYRWRNKFGGMQVSDVKRLRALERENARWTTICCGTCWEKSGEPGGEAPCRQVSRGQLRRE